MISREMNDRVINSRLKPSYRDIDRTQQLTGLVIGLENRSCLFVLVSFVALEILLYINPYRLNLLLITELLLSNQRQVHMTHKYVVLSESPIIGTTN